MSITCTREGVLVHRHADNRPAVRGREAHRVELLRGLAEAANLAQMFPGLADGLDDVGAGSRRADGRELGAEPAAAPVDDVARRTARRAEEQRFAAPRIAFHRGGRLLERAEVRDDPPDFVVGQLVRRHRRPRHAAGDRGGDIGVRTAVRPRAGRQVRAAHAAARRYAVTEGALLAEEDGAVGNRFRIAGERVPCNGGGW